MAQVLGKRFLERRHTSSTGQTRHEPLDPDAGEGPAAASPPPAPPKPYGGEGPPLGPEDSARLHRAAADDVDEHARRLQAVEAHVGSQQAELGRVGSRVAQVEQSLQEVSCRMDLMGAQITAMDTRRVHAAQMDASEFTQALDAFAAEPGRLLTFGTTKCQYCRMQADEFAKLPSGIARMVVYVDADAARKADRWLARHGAALRGFPTTFVTAGGGALRNAHAPMVGLAPAASLLKVLRDTAGQRD